MKKLIFKITFILIPIFFIVISIEITIRSIPNVYSQKNLYLEKYAEEIEILVLGSSHSFYGINPELFSLNSFNASNVSQSLDYDLFIYEKFEDKLVKLKYVLLPISYFTLFSTLEDGAEAWRGKNYVIYYNAPVALTSRHRFEVLNGGFLDHLIKIFTHLTTSDSERNYSDLGFGLDYSNKMQMDLEKTGHAAAARHTTKDLSTSDNNLKTLKRLMDKTEKSNIKVILFTPPALDAYYDNINVAQLNTMKDISISIAKEYPNVSYYDFLKDSRFSINDFHDADHLNGMGAKKLTLILEKILYHIDRTTH